MTSRAYSVAEIDGLRAACSNKWLFGSYSLATIRRGLDRGYSASRSYMPSEKDNGIEQLVRTHMLAGHTAEDLYASDRTASAAGAGTAETVQQAQGEARQSGAQSADAKPSPSPSNHGA